MSSIDEKVEWLDKIYNNQPCSTDQVGLPQHAARLLKIKGYINRSGEEVYLLENNQSAVRTRKMWTVSSAGLYYLRKMTGEPYIEDSQYIINNRKRTGYRINRR